jgi:O-antigen ligase
VVLTAVTSSFAFLLFADRTNFVKRFFPKISIEDGRVVSIQPPPGIEGRYQLIEKGLDLWAQRPIFGYGWFSSPENPNVGFLDFFYVQILVDTGIIGFTLILIFYFQFFRSFTINSQSYPKVISVVGGGWLAGILAGGIGEAWPRVPRLMFLLILLVVASSELNGKEYHLE